MEGNLSCSEKKKKWKIKEDTLPKPGDVGMGRFCHLGNSASVTSSWSTVSPSLEGDSKGWGERGEREARGRE